MNIRFKKYFDKAEKFYRTEETYYHTIHHVKYMFEMYEKFEKRFKAEFGEYDEELLLWAIVFHDAYYLPGFKYNEFISAEIAAKELREDFCNADLFKIQKIIMHTEVSFQDKNFEWHTEAEEKIIHDLDWLSFSNYDEIVLNQIKIFTEAKEVGKIYDTLLIKTNQLKFYQNFQNSNIFTTKTLSHLNPIAQENIKLAIRNFKKEN
jgi:predicted metal-dependent HD superfamily phosphohydrolase